MVGEGGVMVYESFIWYLFNELGEENRALQTGSYILVVISFRVYFI